MQGEPVNEALETARREIDRIDADLVALIKKRLQVVAQIADSRPAIAAITWPARSSRR